MLLLFAIDGFGWAWRRWLTGTRFGFHAVQCFSPTCYSPPSWTSIATGLRPERHGVLRYEDILAGKRPRGYLWEHTGAAGIPAVVVNWSFCAPPPVANRLFVSGYPSERRNFVFPQQAADGWPWEALDLFNPFALGPSDSKARRAMLDTPDGVFFQRALHNGEALAERFCQEIERDRPGLAVLGFTELDRLCHYAYARFQVDAERERILGHVVGLVEKVILRLSPEFTVAVSDHGLDWESPPESDGRGEGHNRLIPEVQEGIFAWAGRGAESLGKLGRIEQEDVLPTLLHVLDIPPAFPIQGEAHRGITHAGAADSQAVRAALEGLGYL